jgi:two-component system, cell cycle response regulator
MHPMSALRVTLLGFTVFERATFETFFRLTSKRTPAYVAEADAKAADYIIADADDEAVARQVQQLGRLGQSLMIGRTPRAGAAAQLSRPINLMLVMRALDSLLNPPDASTPATSTATFDATRTGIPAPGTRGLAPLYTPAPPAAPAQPAREELDIVLRTMAMPAGVNPRAMAAAAVAAAAAPAAPMPPVIKADVPDAADAAHAANPNDRASRGKLRMDHILIVDDSDVALRFMALHLQRYGFEMHLVRSGKEAIEKVSQRHFEFVFLDVMMEGLDGFQTCKAIKRASYSGSRPPPTVVMVTSRGTAMDKLRGTMAGCDAYLTKPLEENALLKIIGDREVRSVGFSDTAAHAASDH